MSLGKSQKEDILNYLQKHKKGITSIEAINLFGATRLSAIIFDLRKEGHYIQAIPKKVKTRYGHTANIVNYVLIK